MDDPDLPRARIARRGEAKPMDGPLMRKINGKFFLVLLIGAVVAGGGIAAVHHFQYQRIGDALLYQARKAEEQGQTARQALFLQRYLEFNPLDNARRGELATLWANDPASSPRRRTEAVRLLDKVVNEEDDPALRRLLVKTALEIRDFRQANHHLHKLLPWKELQPWVAEERKARAQGGKLDGGKGQEDADRAELEFFWGRVLEDDKKIEDALSCYRLAILHGPARQQAYV